MPAAEALAYRAALQTMNAKEDYEYWFMDKKNKDKETSQSSDGKHQFLPPEKNEEVMSQAMSSVENYVLFLKSRGYQQENIKSKRAF